MTVKPTHTDLQNLIANTINLKVGSLTPESGLQDALGIDSLDVLRLLVAAEKRYGLHITDEDMAGLLRYGDLLELLGIDSAESVA